VTKTNKIILVHCSATGSAQRMAQKIGICETAKITIHSESPQTAIKIAVHEQFEYKFDDGSDIDLF
jgi:hypothetical protein